MLSKEIYKRYISDKYSRKDYLTIKDSFLDEKNEKNLDFLLDQEWKEINQKQQPDNIKLNHLLHKIHFIINDKKQQENKSNLKKIVRYYARITAVLFFPVILFFSIYITHRQTETGIKQENSFAEIHAPLGTRTKFILPDGTEGWLNSGSILKYQQPFLQNRNIELIGEALFDVKHMNDEPFLVHFSNLYINVLGTRFNIMDYGDEQISEVILESGNVQILNQNKQLISDIRPDQKFTYNKDSNSATIETVNAANYLMWIDGKLIFRNEPITEVAKRLGRWYNVDIEINDNRLLDINYRATFVDEQLPEVLRLLSLSAPIRYEIEERRMNDKYEFFKRKVKLSYRKNN